MYLADILQTGSAINPSSWNVELLAQLKINEAFPLVIGAVSSQQPYRVPEFPHVVYSTQPSTWRSNTNTSVLGSVFK